ncbi:transposase [Acinetobacter sichuanensis]|uniref:transposase n=1 Tax=Acinetobacter sichuanensis TaxID=2136183 RepID=UPI00280DA016|nr:transposase [Acinetobacter sichuanensis]MDQ9022742.1 transposase [Acinetobacter sichuanensis]
MKNAKLKTQQEKKLLSRCILSETVNDQLENLHQIEHSSHRSINNFMVNVIVVVVAYFLNLNKPTFKNLLNG